MAEKSPPQSSHAKDIEHLDNLVQRASTKKENEPKRKKSVVVVGSTYFPNFGDKNENIPDNIRGNLVLESLKKLNNEGIDVCVVDGSSSEAFVEKVKEINPKRFSEGGVSREPADIHDFINTLEVSEEASKKGEDIPGIIWFVEQQEEGYSQARVEVIKSVTDVVTGSVDHEAIFQMELEKTPLVGEIEKTIKPIVEGRADIVIPDRGIRVKDLGDDRDDFRNYPRFQAVSERKANLLIHQMLVEAGLRGAEDSVLDLFGGTRAIKDKPDLRRLFGETFKIPEDSSFWGKIKPEAYSNAVYFPVYIALALGRKVDSVPIDFSYPKSQTALEAQDESYKEKRQEQFNDIVGGSKLLIDFLGKKLKKVKLAEKVLDTKRVLNYLRKNSVIELEELQWEEKNQFSEELHYDKADLLSILEKIGQGEKIVEQLDDALASYLSNFDAGHSFLNWDEFKQVRKRMNLLKKGVNLFGKEKEAEKIYEKYRDQILNNLYNTTLIFYLLRNSGASRNLDIASFFAEFVEVSKTDYSIAVLFGTSDDAKLDELNSLTKKFNLTAGEKRQIIVGLSRQVIIKKPETDKKELIDDLGEIFEIPPEELSVISKRVLEIS